MASDVCAHQKECIVRLACMPHDMGGRRGPNELLILIDDIGGHRCDDLLVLGVLVRVHVDEAVQEDPLGIEAFLHAILRALPLGLQ